MRTNLQRNPRVIRIASALSADRLRVIGGLHAVWSLADEQTEDGNLPGYTLAVIDEMIGWIGFCAALEAVDWVKQDSSGVTFLRFEEHNGKSAKRRAQESVRKASARSSATDADKKRTREEKRRVTTPISPNGDFELFWKSYPRKEAKQKASQAFKKLHPANGDVERMLAALEAAKKTEQWQRDDGKFIPHASTWLNGRRFEDEGTLFSKPKIDC